MIRTTAPAGGPTGAIRGRGPGLAMIRRPGDLDRPRSTASSPMLSNTPTTLPPSPDALETFPYADPDAARSHHRAGRPGVQQNRGPYTVRPRSGGLEVAAIRAMACAQHRHRQLPPDAGPHPLAARSLAKYFPSGVRRRVRKGGIFAAARDFSSDPAPDAGVRE